MSNLTASFSKRPAEAGFTLMEMLVSLSMFAILLALLSQFLFNGIRLWERNDRAYQRQHQLKVIYQTIDNDLSGMLAGCFLPEGALTGEETELHFWKESEKLGAYQVHYRFEQWEKKVYRSTNIFGGETEEEVWLTGIKAWEFNFYDPESENWLFDWEPDMKWKLPALVRIAVKTEDHDLGKLIFPVRVWTKEAEEDD